MSIKVLGISGSPINNSNTDRLVKTILDATGLDYEFVKLSSINVKPCFACKRCVRDNICKVNDDFPALAEKIKAADALVLGSYIPYNQIDAFSKALLERFWSLRHIKNLLNGKFCATVLTGLSPEALAQANKAIATELVDYEDMKLLDQLTVQGNIPCVTCGVGDDCKKSGIRKHMPGVKSADIPYARVEDQTETCKEAVRIGERIRGCVLANQ